MGAFDQQYWNLCQAAVWVAFRERELVEQFAVADAESYRSLNFYPGMWPQSRKKFSDPNELYEALKLNSLRATGYRPGDPAEVREIDAVYWNHIDPRPPYAWDARRSGKELWTHVMVRRADVLRLWPHPTQWTDRSLFDWDAIHSIHDEVQSEEGQLSDRVLVQEIQIRFEKRFKRKPPSRSSLQKKFKQWRTAAT